MKTLIIYASGHGFDKKIAEEMKSNLGEDVVIVNLKKNPVPPVDRYQRIIIGASFIGRKKHNHIKEFCLKNLDDITDKEIGLFICSVDKGETARQQLREVYPEELLSAAKSTAIFKGSFDYTGKSFLKRLTLKANNRLKPSADNIDFDAVHRFSRRMDRIFNPFLFLA